jgi:YD repeat-containing protein
VTDSEGNSIAFRYDAAGRVTRTTCAEGTFEQTTYSKLDPQLWRDRLGRFTEYTYNANRDLAAVRDPLGESSGRACTLNSGRACSRNV